MLGEGLHIRHYERRFRSELLDLHWDSHWTHEHLDWYQLSAWLDREDALIFLAMDGEAVLGYIGLAPGHDGASWLRLLGLRDGFMPGAILRALWQSAEAKCVEVGISSVMVLIVSSWLPKYLRESGFIFWDDIITMTHLGGHDAMSPCSPAAIRPVEMEDLPHIAHVERLAFRRDWRLSQYDLRQALRVAANATLAEHGGEVLGYQISTVHDEVLHLARLAVRPDQQRRKIGSALLRRLLRDFAGRELKTISVNTQLSNLPSQLLYQRHGFSRNGHDFEIWNKRLPTRPRGIQAEAQR